MCPDQSDWFGILVSEAHSRGADRSVLSKFLQAHPADLSTIKLQVYELLKWLYCLDSYSIKVKLCTLVG